MTVLVRVHEVNLNELERACTTVSHRYGTYIPNRYALHRCIFSRQSYSRRFMKTDGFQLICKNWLQAFNFSHIFSHYAFGFPFIVGAFEPEICRFDHLMYALFCREFMELKMNLDLVLVFHMKTFWIEVLEIRSHRGSSRVQWMSM